MKFLAPSEVSDYYDKPFEQVSPTDSPDEHYMVGEGVFECPECDREISTECREAFLQRTRGHGKGGSGFVERAYCQNCQIEYKRYRKPVVDDVSYQYADNRTDEREEYVCSDCGNRHALTTPKGEFEYVEKPVIKSLESAEIRCPCGSRTRINGLNLNDERSCDNCPREFKFIVSQD